VHDVFHGVHRVFAVRVLPHDISDFLERSIGAFGVALGLLNSLTMRSASSAVSNCMGLSSGVAVGGFI